MCVYAVYKWLLNGKQDCCPVVYCCETWQLPFLYSILSSCLHTNWPVLHTAEGVFIGVTQCLRSEALLLNGIKVFGALHLSKASSLEMLYKFLLLSEAVTAELL